MRYTLFLLFVAVQVSCAQEPNEWKQIQIDRTKSYAIPQEDAVYDMSFYKVPNDTVRAGLKVLNEKTQFNDMIFCEANFVADTLNVLITNAGGVYYNECLIKIIKDKFSVKYKFLVDVLPEIEMLPVEAKLKLNSLEFKRGDIIRGYIEFKAKCVGPCEGQDHNIKGNFKFQI